MYLVDTTNMGHFEQSGDLVKQEFQAIMGSAPAHSWNAVYFNSQAAGPIVYVWGENDFCVPTPSIRRNNCWSRRPGDEYHDGARDEQQWSHAGGFLSISAKWRYERHRLGSDSVFG